MTYTKQEKQKLERVIAVFAERLKESDAFDLVWSDISHLVRPDKVKAMPLTLSGRTRWDMSCWIFPRIMTMWIARGALKRQKDCANSCWRTLRWMYSC